MIPAFPHYKEIIAIVIFVGCIHGLLATRNKRDTDAAYLWAPWSSWSNCNATCNENYGIGVQYRTRRCEKHGDEEKVEHCQVPQGGDDVPMSETSHVILKRSIDLKHYDVAYQTCYGNCPHGRWSQWSGWTGCSNNLQIRARQCTSPEPSNGGRGCVGEQSETRICNVNIWSHWTAYSSCSVTCGTGQKTRTRQCMSGTNCFGSNSEHIACTLSHCAQPISGQWGVWSSYGDCSTTCGTGVRYRTRRCDSPAPANGGLQCIGNTHEFQKCLIRQCPIDGGWSNFTHLACSTSCGTGVKAAFRTCTNPAPAFGGKNCTGSTHTFEICKMAECSIDGGWTDWGDWGQCSVTSGVGVRIRTRNCTQPAPKFNGKDCVGDKVMTDFCVERKWSDWTPWSKCDVTCGNGTRNRNRTCTTGSDCVGDATEISACANKECPIDGMYGEWSNWTECTATCGHGFATRIRKCDSPNPAYGGHDCLGGFLQQRDCNLQDCPVDGGYGTWSEWSECSNTCGNGTMHRIRHCDNPVPKNGGQECTGHFTDKQSCNLKDCAIDGGYGAWSEWSECSNTCGNGTMHRVRHCDNPVPKNGGQECTGHFIDKQSCNLKECPIDGGWSAWVNQTCNVSCGKGTVISIRACSNPTPKLGGKDCDGPFHQTYTCQEKPCAIDGAWSTWTQWGACDKTCGNGTKSRTRSCDNPTPQYGGQTCSGDAVETQHCFEKDCPIDGGWGPYKSLPCSVTCGDGQQVSIRECDSPAPQYGGEYCHGISHEIKDCHMPSCSQDGSWSAWSLFGSCGSVCGDGYTLRYRTCTNPVPTNGGNNCTGNSEERLACNSGPCPHDVPTCDKAHIIKELHDNYLYAPIRPTPCDNMDYIPQESMMKDVCNAPDDFTLWIPSKDIRASCDSIPLYTPLTKVHRQYNIKKYGVVLDCYRGKLKYATETCEKGVHEVAVDLEPDDGWDYYTTTW